VRTYNGWTHFPRTSFSPLLLGHNTTQYKRAATGLLRKAHTCVIASVPELYHFTAYVVFRAQSSTKIQNICFRKKYNKFS
jgi:hypothetical protein